MQVELDDIGGARELAKYRIEAAYDNLASAKRCFDEEDYLTANNRAYYAIYRAISACLALEFKSYKSHGQVLGNFNKDYVHTGIFPKDIARRISRVQEVRHESDYNDFYIVSVDETREQVKTAEDVVGMIDKYIKERIDGKN